MDLDLTDEETAARTGELHNIVENDRYMRQVSGWSDRLRLEPD